MKTNTYPPISLDPYLKPRFSQPVNMISEQDDVNNALLKINLFIPDGSTALSS